MDERWEEARAAAERGEHKAALELLRRDKARAAALGDVEGLRAVVELAAEIRDRARGRTAADAFLLGKSANDDLHQAIARRAATQPQPASPGRSAVPSEPATPVAARIDDLERRLRRFQEELAELRALVAAEAAPADPDPRARAPRPGRRRRPRHGRGRRTAPG